MAVVVLTHTKSLKQRNPIHDFPGNAFVTKAVSSFNAPDNRMMINPPSGNRIAMIPAQNMSVALIRAEATLPTPQADYLTTASTRAHDNSQFTMNKKHGYKITRVCRSSVRGELMLVFFDDPMRRERPPYSKLSTSWILFEMGTNHPGNTCFIYLVNIMDAL